MELIGYACSYIPVELLSATGLRPYRLLHGNTDLSRQAEKYVRIDACPMVKSNISYILNNQDKFRVLVGSTGCDMSRRMFDIIEETTDIPVLVLNNPRTNRAQIFNDEIDWLVKQLENLSGRKFSDDLIAKEIEKWESERESYRAIDKKRGALPSLISTASFHNAIINYHQGNITSHIDIKDEPINKPRVYLLGSAVTYESHPILEMLEKEMRIVGDFNCGLSRFLNIHITENNLDGIKSAYYNQPPCVYKRPNDKLYSFIGGKLEEFRCKGIVAWTLDYCDNYEFELKKIESVFDLPVLRIKSDFSFQNLSQLRSRISAFAEMLCSIR
jgi:benzoyl-CoA reductase/2-hydroxyglutaryl-CoA dehydratase subunit BcrC/BadD/HgdB